MKDIIKKIKSNSDGTVIYYSEEELKAKHNHTRKIQKRIYEEIVNQLPHKTKPHRWFRLEGETYINEIISEGDSNNTNK